VVCVWKEKKENGRRKKILRESSTTTTLQTTLHPFLTTTSDLHSSPSSLSLHLLLPGKTMTKEIGIRELSSLSDGTLLVFG